MTAELLAALITKIGIPELARWLSQRGQNITDEQAIARLHMTTAEGLAVGRQWLALHPVEARHVAQDASKEPPEV